LALAIAKEKMQMPLPGTMGAPDIRRADVNQFFEVYTSISSCTRSDRAGNDVITTFWNSCYEQSRILPRW
jgi:hypothetical protein